MLSISESGEGGMPIILPGLLGLYLTPPYVGSPLTAEAKNHPLYNVYLKSGFQIAVKFRSPSMKRTPSGHARFRQILPLTMASNCEDVLPDMPKAKAPASILSTKKDMMIEDRGLPPLLRDMDPQEIAILEKKLKSKIDWRMMPPMIVMYIMNYLDRSVHSDHSVSRRYDH